ncbi:MAG: hypothetical protein WB586_05295 [Chthoniobacterales bacterium]
MKSIAHQYSGRIHHALADLEAFCAFDRGPIICDGYGDSYGT